MDALSSVSQRTPEPLSRRSASSSGAEGGFAQAFAALSGEDDAKPTAPKTPVRQRQADADAGKSLPDTGDEPAAAMIDPRLLWLPGGLLATETPVPSVATPALANPLLAATAAPVAQGGATALPIALPQDVQTSLAQLGIGKGGMTSLKQIFEAADRLVTAQAGKADGAPVAQPALAPIAPMIATATATTAPLSAELAAMLKHADKATVDDKRGTGDSIVPTTTMTTAVALQNIVQPTADTRHVPLDLRDDQGLQRMIDRIENLRDDADSRDTRIRLVPDALGAVDVSVRTTGDSLHVHFTAENEATRTLLTDAQPRLLELADSRGVRITGASVDAGTSGGGRQAQSQSQPRQPSAPVSPLLSPSTTTDASGDDARLA